MQTSQPTTGLKPATPLGETGVVDSYCSTWLPPLGMKSSGAKPGLTGVVTPTLSTGLAKEPEKATGSVAPISSTPLRESGGSATNVEAFCASIAHWGQVELRSAS